MNEITKWLIGKDYQEGVKLYEKYGTNKAYLKWYKVGKNSVSYKSLIDELKKLENVIKTTPQPQKEVEIIQGKSLFSKPKIQEKELKSILPSDRDDAPEDVKKMVARRKELYQQGNRLHAIASTTKDENERAIVAVKIVLTFDELEELWRKSHFYDLHLKLPIEVPEIDLKITEGESLLKRLNTLRTYRTKCNKGILKAERLPIIEAEIHELELLIEGTQDEII